MDKPHANELIATAISYIFKNFDPKPEFKIQTEPLTTGYNIGGFHFLYTFSTDLYEDVTEQVRIVAQYNDNACFAFMKTLVTGDDSHSYYACVESSRGWVKVNVQAISAFLLAFEQLSNVMESPAPSQKLLEKMKAFIDEVE